jgi:uncharacterized protein
MNDFIEVGKVKEIWRYPVKSMAGEQLEEAYIFWHGINGDRRAAFVRGDNQSNFPWLTGRQEPQIVQYKPRYRDPAEVVEGVMDVQTPDGSILVLDSPELQAEMAEIYGRDVSLIRIGRGIFDALPLSIMSEASAQALADAIPVPLDVRRWRQNIIIETFNGRPFIEEDWVDEALTIGEARLRLNVRIPRCVFINVDPATSAKDARVLKYVANQRDNCVGVACAPEAVGTIRVGDVVRLNGV